MQLTVRNSPVQTWKLKASAKIRRILKSVTKYVTMPTALTKQFAMEFNTVNSALVKVKSITAFLQSVYWTGLTGFINVNSGHLTWEELREKNT